MSETTWKINLEAERRSLPLSNEDLFVVDLLTDMLERTLEGHHMNVTLELVARLFAPAVLQLTNQGHCPSAVVAEVLGRALDGTQAAGELGAFLERRRLNPPAAGTSP